MIDALVHTKRLAAIGAEAAAAEAAGHGAVWVSETGNDPFLHSHAAAVATSTAEIGTAIAVAFARSPMTVAQTAWWLCPPCRDVLLGTSAARHPSARRRS